MLLVVAIIFIVLGVLIKYGKMYFLIAGYNTMSKEKQNQYDIEGIANVFKNVMFTMAALLIIGFIASFWLEEKRFEAIVILVSLAIGLPYLLIVSNLKKFKINNDHDINS